MALKPAELLLIGGVALGGFWLWNRGRTQTTGYHKEDGTYFEASQPTIRTIQRQDARTDRTEIRWNTIGDVFSKSGSSNLNYKPKKTGDIVALTPQAKNQIRDLKTPKIRGEIQDILRAGADTSRIKPATPEFINLINAKNPVPNFARVGQINLNSKLRK